MAVKFLLHLQSDLDQDQIQELAIREIEILLKLYNPGVLSFKGWSLPRRREIV
jgi:hypothetical protein